MDAVRFGAVVRDAPDLCAVAELGGDASAAAARYSVAGSMAEYGTPPRACGRQRRFHSERGGPAAESGLNRSLTILPCTGSVSGSRGRWREREGPASRAGSRGRSPWSAVVDGTVDSGVGRRGDEDRSWDAAKARRQSWPAVASVEARRSGQPFDLELQGIVRVFGPYPGDGARAPPDRGQVGISRCSSRRGCRRTARALGRRCRGSASSPWGPARSRRPRRRAPRGKVHALPAR